MSPVEPARCPTAWTATAESLSRNLTTVRARPQSVTERRSLFESLRGLSGSLPHITHLVLESLRIVYLVLMPRARCPVLSMANFAERKKHNYSSLDTQFCVVAFDRSGQLS